MVPIESSHAGGRSNGEHDVEEIREAKFSFRVRNIFELNCWRNKSTLKLQSRGELLGITEVQLKSEIQAIGYDLSKIDGYDENRIVPMHKWKITKHYLL